jgi:hypothetical protein
MDKKENISTQLIALEEAKKQFQMEQREVMLKTEDHLFQNYSSFDKAMLTFSSGAVGLILTFYKELKPSSDRFFIDCATFSFICSIGLILLSFLFGMKAFKVKLRGILKRAAYETVDINFEIRPYALWTDFCNIAAGVTFFLGIVLLAAQVLNTH